MCGVKCAERGGRPRKAGVVPKGLRRPGRRKPGPGAPPQGTGGAGLIKEGRKVGGGGVRLDERGHHRGPRLWRGPRTSARSRQVAGIGECLPPSPPPPRQSEVPGRLAP